MFNLKENIDMNIHIENFQPSKFVMECGEDQHNKEVKYTIFDHYGRSLDLYILISTKVAGKKAVFFVKNCVIDNTF